MISYTEKGQTAIGNNPDKATCGNCRKFRLGLNSCALFGEGYNPTGPGCLLLLESFEDRGYQVQGESQDIHPAIDHRDAIIPKLVWSGLGSETSHKIKLGMEFPPELALEITRLSDFNFALTREVLNHPKLAQIYREYGQGPTYLDNSTNEEGKPCSLNEIGRAVGLVNPTLVVAPDFLGDSKATLRALPEFTDLFGKEGALPVVQGSSLEEVFKCSRSLRESSYTRIAVPYDIVRGKTSTLVSMSRTRSLVVGYLVSLGFTNIHLLGLTSLEEFVIYRQCPEVKKNIASVDTGMPVSLGLKGLEYPYEPVRKTGPTLQDMNKSVGQYPTGFAMLKYMRFIYWNIAYLRMLL